MQKNTGCVTRSATMADVARKAGVSRTTVSFVLNDAEHANIPASTRQRVLDSATALGYRPNAAARALVSQRSGLYGLVTEIVTSPFAVDVIKGSQEQAWENDKFLLIAPSDHGRESSEHAIEKLLDQQVEGLIIAATWHRAVIVPEIAHQRPCVLVNCFDADGAVPSIVPDEVGGGRRAARALLDFGHRSIGHITLTPGIPGQEGRLSGFRSELLAAGVTLPDERIITGDGTAESGYRGASLLLDSEQPPTAIFCGNDRAAMGAFDAIKERGLRIPDDISVIGYDNQDHLADQLRPGLTTVALPFVEMGAEGVKRLNALSAGSRIDDQKVTIDCPLVMRSSVGIAVR